MTGFEPGSGSGSRPGLTGAGHRRVSARPATEAERAGQAFVMRAGVAAMTGGGLIAAVAATFGPRFFVADVRAVGIVVGVLSAALGLALLLGVRPGAATGPLLLAAGVVALPVAAGGFVVGSLLVLGAGVVLVSVQPAPADAVVALEDGQPVLRAVAAAVDVVLAAIVVVGVSVTPLGDVVRAAAGLWASYQLWAFAWLVVTVPLALVSGCSPGAWLCGLRLHGRDGGRARAGGVVVRQVLRGVVAVGLTLAVVSTALRIGPVVGLAIAALAVAAGLVAVRVPATRSWLDSVTDTRQLAERVRVR